MRAVVSGLLFILLLASPVFAAQNIRIVSVSYGQHFEPTEPVPFAVTVINNQLTDQFAEVDVTLTNIETGAETTLTPVLTGTVPALGTGILQNSYTVPEGLYTVSFPLFDGDGLRSDTLRGDFPLHVGVETESLHVFPEVLHLGTLPPGRSMHPVPIEVRWNFFRFNRLRVDQPFTVRIYTDNAARFTGTPGAARLPSAGGLVSMDGRFVIPVKVWCLNFGPDTQTTGWDAALAGPPPVDEDDLWLGPPLLEGGRNESSASWVRLPDLSDMTANPSTWRRLIGQDPTDSRFVADSNRTGDFTLTSPFTFYLATETGPTAVEGTYAATLVVELWNP